MLVKKRMLLLKKLATIIALAASVGATVAPTGVAAEAAGSRCKTMRLANAGWSDNTAGNAIASILLDGLGYTLTERFLSLPVIFVGLKNRQVDIFLDNWWPGQESITQPYLSAGAVEILGQSVKGAHSGLAVPEYTYEKGLHSFADIVKFKDSLNHEIYGVDPGSGANRITLSILGTEALGLKDFELVESSEQGMLSQVKRKIRRGEDVVFTAWEPHPMNLDIKMKYLDDPDAFFGRHGVSRVYIIARAGYKDDCPNVAKFLGNLVIPLSAENVIMAAIRHHDEAPLVAAKSWIRAHPNSLDRWLEGVTTINGGDGRAAIHEVLGF